MPQQINLCTPIFLTQKRYFSAQTMASALGVFVLLGGLLSGYSALVQALQAGQAELVQREQLLAELKRGLLREGQGHAARLQLVAQSIPPQAWVTAIRAEELRMELSGYTLEPAALNGWMERLARSPLLEGQRLSVVKVERVAADGRASGVVPTAVAARAATAPLWSYTLVTAQPAPAGGQP